MCCVDGGGGGGVALGVRPHPPHFERPPHPRFPPRQCGAPCCSSCLDRALLLRHAPLRPRDGCHGRGRRGRLFARAPLPSLRIASRLPSAAARVLCQLCPSALLRAAGSVAVGGYPPPHQAPHAVHNPPEGHSAWLATQRWWRWRRRPWRPRRRWCRRGRHRCGTERGRRVGGEHPRLL